MCILNPARHRVNTRDLGRLTSQQAELYTQWLANDRRLRGIVAEMEQVSAEAIEIILQTDRFRT